MISFELNTNQVQKLKTIHALFVEENLNLSSFSEEKKAFIKKQSLISNIGASTRIENAVLTNIEIDWLDTVLSVSESDTYETKEDFIKAKLTKDKQRSIEEVAGYRDAINIVYDTSEKDNSLRESDIKGLHRELMKFYSEASHHSGNYKTQKNNVVERNGLTGEQKNVLTTADPGVMTNTSMSDLVTWFNKSVTEEAWIIPVAVEFIFRFLAIHPFQDGNGRLSRLLFQHILISSEDDHISNLIPYVAVDRNIEIKRSQYYQQLRKCSEGVFGPDSTEYQYHYFLDYMLEILVESIQNLKHYSEKYENYFTLNETDIKVYTCFKEEPERNLQTKEIIEATDLPRRTIVYALNKLVEKQFLQVIGKGRAVKYKLVF